MAKWNDSQMASFIHLYEMHRCLWKSDTADYKNREKRSRALRNIVAKMKIPDFTEADCKNKIKNVRSHYCQELKKIKKSMRSGCGSDELYKPTLSWFQALDRFLRPLVIQKADSNLEIPEIDMTEVEEFQLEVRKTDPTSPATPTASDISEPPESKDACCVMLEQPISPESAVECRTPRGNKRMRDDQEVRDKFLSSTMEANASTASKRDEFDIFGQSVAAQLNNMRFEDALELQLQIQQLITQERLFKHRQQGGRQSVPSSRNTERSYSPAQELKFVPPGIDS